MTTSPFALRWRTVLFAVACALVVTACSPAEPDATPDPEPSTTSSGSVSTTAPTGTSSLAADGGSSTSTAPPDEPGRGGSVIVGLSFVPNSVNELNDDGFAAARWMRHLVRPAAYVLQPDGTRGLHLVTDDPSFDNAGLFLAEDGSLEVTWNIDPAARWSDGERITADDFALFHESQCDDGAPLFAGEFLDADPGQVRVRFPTPTASFRDAVAHVMPAHVVDRDLICVDDGVTWPSTGPFLIDSTGGPVMELIRNPAYWRRDPETDLRLPYLDSIVFREISEDPGRLLSSGSIDVVEGDAFTGPAASPLPAGVALVQGPGAVWEFLTFQFGPDNRNDASLNDRIEFRQAVAHALDRFALAEAVGWLPTNGVGGSLDGPWAAYDHDPAEAAALLADLCAELERDCEADPPRVVFTTTSNADERPRIAGLAQDMLGAVGIEVELQLEDSALFFGESAPLGTYDVGMWAWLVASEPVARSDVFHSFDPASPGPDGRNWYRWGVPGSDSTQRAGEAAALLDALATTVDPGGFADVLVRFEGLVADELIVIPIATRPVVVVHRAEVVGPAPNAGPSGLLWNAELWFRTDG